MHNEVQYLSSHSWAVDRSALENTIKSVSQRAWGPQGGEDSDLMSKAYHLSQDCRAVTLQTAAPRPQGAERLGTIWARCSPWLCGRDLTHPIYSTEEWQVRSVCPCSQSKSASTFSVWCLMTHCRGEAPRSEQGARGLRPWPLHFLSRSFREILLLTKAFTLAYNYGWRERGKQREYNSCIFLMDLLFKLK